MNLIVIANYQVSQNIWIKVCVSSWVESSQNSQVRIIYLTWILLTTWTQFFSLIGSQKRRQNIEWK